LSLTQKERKGGSIVLKMLLFIGSAFLMIAGTSQGAGPGGGFRGGSFHGGFAARSGRPAFEMGRGMRGNFAFNRGFGFNQDRRFFHRGRRFFNQQVFWPVFWYPYSYYDPLAYSYLDYGPDNDYQYWDNSAPPVQPESFNRSTGNSPTVIVINTGNARPADPNSNTGYINSGYSFTGAAPQQRIAVQDPNDKIGPQADPRTFVPPAVPQPTPQTPAKGTQTRPQVQPGPFGNLVLVSWLQNAGKDVIYVQNIETNDVQMITSEPNLDNFRIVELHRNADPKLFEAVISNGSQQGPVRFHF
jgi:hypothetical protein